ncbi:mitochondrial ATPase-like protein [Cucurbitaria berberidis CBS 394.84]|uniref:Mitochondrial ATPase-like protein n=1 Tax=Cucurbitaria berberidis CBS 394.84 TaxID=1168544 RepID=A0A9P4LBU7_9PLEO|nr:mitochondrial ATPase-like protein [Cucurbitaria berberidis CBS 394.84]KAF1849966.1 mitochondrial ATPase-like protein [Cucurbitaria berberidis CBS 394.84]
MPSTGVTITNPLVLYRSLITTQKIRPDPAQHRLALHLQKLYDRLIDYEPKAEYSQRLQALSRVVDSQNAPTTSTNSKVNRFGRRGVWTSLLAQKERRDSVALTRVLTSHEEAIQLQSPKGLMLHGGVGTGKSMLIDLFQESLPNRKKRRWHFNTFMLDTISRLEQLRRSRALMAGPGEHPDEYSLLLVARDLIETSPILFLDEFQLPDRAASKILSNLMTSFFQLGGVLIATSNRMPEELAKAAGMEFNRPVSRPSRLGWNLGRNANVRRDDGAGQMGEFSAFLDVLKARCEVWEMEGKRDYRKLEREEGGSRSESVQVPPLDNISSSSVAAMSGATALTPREDAATEPATTPSEVTLPKNYLIQPSTAEDLTIFAESFNTLVELATQHSYPIPWTPSSLTVYGRPLSVPAQHNGVAFFQFSELCGAILGPADYITLASTYHTFILTDVPVMGFQQKEEARRFITLLDALYEARCRLLITAVAGPDDLLFPLPKGTTTASGLSEEAEQGLLNDAVYPETYSEIYQDLNSPFRPNVSSYNSDNLAADALEDDPPNRVRRPGSSFTDERRLHPGIPNFADIGGLTGEDEKFAVKRAESRIWEMCSGRWWDRSVDVHEETGSDTPWWRPLPLSSRHWEHSSTPPSSPASLSPNVSKAQPHALPPNVKILSKDELERDRQKELEDMFAHGASPFRTHPDAPPKFSGTHAWGMVTWGKKAGAWGKGVEGLEERKRGEEEAQKVEEVKDNGMEGKGR